MDGWVDEWVSELEDGRIYKIGGGIDRWMH